MPDLIHVILLGSHAATLAVASVFCNRCRRHSRTAASEAEAARLNRADAQGFSDRAQLDADKATSQANRATREVAKAAQAAFLQTATAPIDPEPADVIPFRRPSAKPIGPRLADLDEPA